MNLYCQKKFEFFIYSDGVNKISVTMITPEGLQFYQNLMNCMQFILDQYHYTEFIKQPIIEHTEKPVVKETTIEPVIKKSTVREYKPRAYRVKATEYERMKSREYYVAHREEILKKRRIHAAKMKRKQNKA